MEHESDPLGEDSNNRDSFEQELADIDTDSDGQVTYDDLFGSEIVTEEDSDLSNSRGNTPLLSPARSSSWSREATPPVSQDALSDKPQSNMSLGMKLIMEEKSKKQKEALMLQRSAARPVQEMISSYGASSLGMKLMLEEKAKKEREAYMLQTTSGPRALKKPSGSILSASASGKNGLSLGQLLMNKEKKLRGSNVSIDINKRPPPAFDSETTDHVIKRRKQRPIVPASMMLPLPQAVKLGAVPDKLRSSLLTRSSPSSGGPIIVGAVSQREDGGHRRSYSPQPGPSGTCSSSSSSFEPDLWEEDDNAPVGRKSTQKAPKKPVKCYERVPQLSRSRSRPVPAATLVSLVQTKEEVSDEIIKDIGTASTKRPTVTRTGLFGGKKNHSLTPFMLFVFPLILILLKT